MAFITPFFLTIRILLALALAFLIYEANLTTNNKLEPIPGGQHAHLSRFGHHDTGPEHGPGDGFAVPLESVRAQGMIENHYAQRPLPKASPNATDTPESVFNKRKISGVSHSRTLCFELGEERSSNVLKLIELMKRNKRIRDSSDSYNGFMRWLILFEFLC